MLKISIKLITIRILDGYFFGLIEWSHDWHEWHCANLLCVYEQKCICLACLFHRHAIKELLSGKISPQAKDVYILGVSQTKLYVYHNVYVFTRHSAFKLMEKFGETI